MNNSSVVWRSGGWLGGALALVCSVGCVDRNLVASPELQSRDPSAICEAAVTALSSCTSVATPGLAEACVATGSSPLACQVACAPCDAATKDYFDRLSPLLANVTDPNDRLRIWKNFEAGTGLPLALAPSTSTGNTDRPTTISAALTSRRGARNGFDPSELFVPLLAGVQRGPGSHGSGSVLPLANPGSHNSHGSNCTQCHATPPAYGRSNGSSPPAPVVGVKLPDGTIIQPNGTVQLPNGITLEPTRDVTLPDGTILLRDCSTVRTSSGQLITTLPPGGLTTTDGTLIQPIPTGGLNIPAGDITKLPNGTVLLPGAVVIFPDGTVFIPDGTVVRPDGTVLLPDGGVKLPSGALVLPDVSAVKLADGTLVPAVNDVVTLPDGRTVKRATDESIVLPNGTVVTHRPDGSWVLPDGSVIRHNPDGSFTLPGGQTVAGPDVVKNAAKNYNDILCVHTGNWVICPLPGAPNDPSKDFKCVCPNGTLLFDATSSAQPPLQSTVPNGPRNSDR
jgi:hypothetical protein